MTSISRPSRTAIAVAGTWIRVRGLGWNLKRENCGYLKGGNFTTKPGPEEGKLYTVAMTAPEPGLGSRVIPVSEP